MASPFILRRSLARILVSADAVTTYRAAIADWRMIDDFTLRVLTFVGPLLQVPGVRGTVASRAIVAALDAHSRAGTQQIELARCAYFTSLIVALVHELKHWRISVFEGEETWKIWHHDRPLLDMLEATPPGTLMVRRRVKPLDEAKLAVVLVGQLLRLYELDAIAFEATTFLEMVKQSCGNTDSSGSC